MKTPGYIEDNIFVELGLEALPNEEKVAMLSQMNDLIHKRVVMRIAENMPEEAQKEIDNSEGLTEEQQLEVVIKHVPNLTELILQEVDALKEEMKALGYQEQIAGA